MIEKVWIIIVPLTFGIMASLGFLKMRSRKKKPQFFDGFLAWILFVVFAIIGELLAHALYPGAYKRIGDNPEQIAGLILSIFASFLINPILYIGVRRKRRSSKEST